MYVSNVLPISCNLYQMHKVYWHCTHTIVKRLKAQNSLNSKKCETGLLTCTRNCGHVVVCFGRDCTNDTRRKSCTFNKTRLLLLGVSLTTEQEAIRKILYKASRKSRCRRRTPDVNNATLRFESHPYHASVYTFAASAFGYQSPSS
jgi:hypothetical protein